MSRESDHIHLNSDDLLFEGQNDMHGVIDEKLNPEDDVYVIKSPTEYVQDQVMELLGDEVIDSQRVTGFAKSSILGGLAENTRDKAEADVETQLDSGDRGSDLKTDVSSAVEICSSNVEGANFNNNDENPNTETQVTKNPISISVFDNELKAKKDDEFDPSKDPVEVENLITNQPGSYKNDRNLGNAHQVVVGLRSTVSGDKNMYCDMSMTNSKSVFSPTEFCISDLVWGKVRSHPWWPGQILDPSTSSGQAKKYYKRNGYLIAYFWDHTFAWNEGSQIKPFRDHFLPLEKQSSSENFQHAIHCALDEVSRRVELGLACPCIPNEVYQKLKTQIFINAGIPEEFTRRDGGDRFSSASAFEPLKLVRYIKTYAHHTCFRGFNRVDFVTSQAQLLAFNRWRGYSQLPEFQMLGGLLESETENTVLVDVRTFSEAPQDVIDLEINEVTYKNDKLTNSDSSSRKRKDRSGDSIIREKKEKTLSSIIVENRKSNGKNGLGKTSGRKRKGADESMNESSAKRTESHLRMEEINKSQDFNKTFRVGASILRVASQMNRSSSLLKRVDDLSQKVVVKSERKEKSPSKNLFLNDSSSPLSQLCLAARNPKKNSPLNSVISFFSEFRDSVSLENVSSCEHEEMEAATFLEKVSSCEHEKMEASTFLEKVSSCEHEEMEAATFLKKVSSCEHEELEAGTFLEKVSSGEQEELEVATSLEKVSSGEQEELEVATSLEKVSSGEQEELEVATSLEKVSSGEQEELEVATSLEKVSSGEHEELEVATSLEKISSSQVATSLEKVSSCEHEELEATTFLEKVSSCEHEELKAATFLEKVCSGEHEELEAATSLEKVSSSEHATSLEKVSSSEHEELEAAATSSEKGVSSIEPTSIKEVVDPSSGGDLISKKNQAEPSSGGDLISKKNQAEPSSGGDLISKKNQAEPSSGGDLISKKNQAEPSSGGDLISKKNQAEPSDLISKNNHAEPSQKCNEDLFEADASPTVLILNFTDFDSVPSEANLNKIFSQYGHVIESQTEVLKKSRRAKVIFTRRADAEVAFSNAGKYSTFGPSLVSYRLRYMPSAQHKATSAAGKRTKKASVRVVDANAT